MTLETIRPEPQPTLRHTLPLVHGIEVKQRETYDAVSTVMEGGTVGALGVALATGASGSVREVAIGTGGDTGEEVDHEEVGCVETGSALSGDLLIAGETGWSAGLARASVGVVVMFDHVAAVMYTHL